MTAMPFLPHATVVANLIDLLSPFVRQQCLGRVFPPQTGVCLSEINYLDPDVIVLASSQYRKGHRRAVTASLAIEVVSRSNTRAPREVRESKFAAAGVPEVWYVDPPSRTLTIVRLAEGSYVPAAQFSGADTVTSTQLPGLEFGLDELWVDVHDQDVDGGPE
jgi:Uma2 family endonuclease